MVKESTCNAGDMGLIPGLGRFPGGGNGNPLQCSGKSHGQRSLVGYSPWGHKESNTTEHLNTHTHKWSTAFKNYESPYYNYIILDRGGLACCSPWGHKESSDTTERQLNTVYQVCFNKIKIYMEKRIKGIFILFTIQVTVVSITLLA